MKKWHKRTLCILALGIAGTVALAYRPAFCKDGAEWLTYLPTSPEISLTEHDHAQGMSFQFSWDFTKHPTGVLLQGDVEADAFSHLKEAQWDIQVHTEQDRMKVRYNTPALHSVDPTCQVDTKYYAYFQYPSIHYLPNGNMATTHRLYLCCDVTITPSWWQKKTQTTAILVLAINPTLGSVDIETAPRVYQHKEKNYRLITKGTEPALPSRYCGTERERALQYLLYEFADAALNADSKALEAYYAKAAEDVARLSEPNKEWPACWEEASAEAERGAQLIELTLTKLQEHNCYDMQELADFINGPVFARIFGTGLQKREKIDFGENFESNSGGIEFEILTEEEFYKNDTEDEKK